MITPKQIIKTERELHMMGDMVAVCWNMSAKTKTSRASGIEYTRTIWMRCGDPYIDFVTIRYDERSQGFYEDEDSPVDGGISVDTAQQLIDELNIAIRYMEENGYAY